MNDIDQFIINLANHLESLMDENADGYENAALHLSACVLRGFQQLDAAEQTKIHLLGLGLTLTQAQQRASDVQLIRTSIELAAVALSEN